MNDSHELVWVKGLPTKEINVGFNYNMPIYINGEFPLLNKQFSTSSYSYVFYVVQSEKKGEKLFSMYDGNEIHTFYTDVIKSNREATINLSYLAKGAIVNYNFYSSNFKQKKTTGVFYLDNTYDRAKTALYEILICNDCEGPLKRNQIETYLALKYGITLQNKEKYWSSKGEKIWDETYNPAFNHHIIGIAKDTYFGLEQLATTSNEEMDIRWSQSKDQTKLKDQTFVLLGDNGKDKEFDEKSNRLKRQWLAQNKGEFSVAVDLTVSIKPEKEVKYQLYTSTGIEIQHDLSDTLQLSFKNLVLDKQTTTYLSIGKIKPFSINLLQDTLGINHSYKLVTNAQGIPPFYIQAMDMTTDKAYFFITEQSSFSLEHLPTGTYAFTVRDSQEQQANIESVFLDFESSNWIEFSSNWTLHGREMLAIKPKLKNKSKQYGYRWYLEDKIISTAPVLRVNYPGEFRLEVTDVKGKYQRFNFSVHREIKTTSMLDEQWLVSPNPVKEGEEFTVHYLFESSKYVDFYIYTLEGKFIQRNKLGLIQGGAYTYQLTGKTTYLLVSIINNTTSIQKLIVK